MMRRREFLPALPAGILGTLRSSQAGPDSCACILLVLVGGPSQLDTWDPKPDAPSHIRSRWSNIRTNVPGIELTELFPRMAREADKFTLVRSVYHDGEPVHETGLKLIQTGAAADSILLSGSAIGVPGERQLRCEPRLLRERYGHTRFGDNCLMARRLIERGAKCVTVSMFDSVFCDATWDVHGTSPFASMRAFEERVAPAFDLAYTALLQDLFFRGMLNSTLVVATGEFGRTPRINPAGGRDHWTRCWTALLSGGGIQGGEVYGSSDATASEPRDNPVHISRLFSTITAKLGKKIPGSDPLAL